MFYTVAGATGLAGGAGVLQVLTDDNLAGPVQLWVSLGLILLVGFALVWVRVIATITRREDIAIRGLIRTRRIPWSDVQDIRVEVNPGHLAKDSAPKEIVVVYDQTGRRRTLPHVNEKNLSGHGATLSAETQRLRTTWELRRGADWAPIAQVRAKAAERARYGVSSWMVGLIAAMVAVPVAIVVFLIGLFGDLTEGPLSFVFEPEFIMVAPLVVYFVVSIASVIRRRRARVVLSEGGAADRHDGRG